MVANLNPVDREYRVGDRDKVFIKSQSEGHEEKDLVEVVVSFIEEGKPVFRVISEGKHHNDIFRTWQVVFT
jgi:hypothetical protein